MAGARNSGGWPEAGNSLELRVIYLSVHFFFSLGESSLFYIDWWGGPGGEF